MPKPDANNMLEYYLQLMQGAARKTGDTVANSRLPKREIDHIMEGAGGAPDAGRIQLPMHEIYRRAEVPYEVWPAQAIDESPPALRDHILATLAKQKKAPISDQQHMDRKESDIYAQYPGERELRVDPPTSPWGIPGKLDAMYDTEQAQKTRQAGGAPNPYAHLMPQQAAQPAPRQAPQMMAQAQPAPQLSGGVKAYDPGTELMGGPDADKIRWQVMAQTYQREIALGNMTEAQAHEAMKKHLSRSGVSQDLNPF